MSAVALVARREVLDRVRERAFAIGTAVTLAIVAAVIVLPSLFGGGDSEVLVAVASPGSERVARAAAKVDDPFDVVVRVRRVGSDAEVRRLLADKDADAGVVGGGRTVLRRGGTPDGGVAALQAGSQQLRQRAAPPPPLPVSTVDADSEDSQGFAAIALIILYGQLVTYGIWVAVGIVQEKASRIVEILLAAIRPRELLTGKVIGIGIVGCAQLLFIGAIGLLIASVSGRVEVGSAELAALPVVLIWFLLGYALYACAFAVVGALVQRQEDVQSAATPVVLALLASFFLAFNAVDDPGSALAKVLTYIPTSSPLVVPVRVIGGDIAAWEVALSVAILLATVAALIGVAGRVYANAVLQTGGRVPLRSALRRTRRAPA